MRGLLIKKPIEEDGGVIPWNLHQSHLLGSNENYNYQTTNIIG